MYGNLLEGAARAWRLAADFIRDRRRSRRMLDEVAALDPGDTTRVLSDVGMTGNDFTIAMSNPFASEDLLSHALASVGVDPDEFSVRNVAWLHDMQRTCVMCRLRGRCRRILSHGEFARRHGDFCPNSRDFTQIPSIAGGNPPRPCETAWRDP